MRFTHAASLFALSCTPYLAFTQQAGTQSKELKPVATAQAQQTAVQPAMAPAPAAAAAPAPSELLQQAMDTLQQTVGGLKLEKWKGGSVRAEAAANVSSIQKDLDGTLPGLLKDADASPNSLSSLLPVYRNVDALYDVLLRVYEAARVSGPGDQVAALQQAMGSLESGRRSLSERLMATASAQEKQITQLQTTLQAKSAPPVCPVVAPPPPPAPAKKPAVRKKKPATPATPQTAKPAANGTGTTTKPATPQ